MPDLFADDQQVVPNVLDAEVLDAEVLDAEVLDAEVLDAEVLDTAEERRRG